MARSFVGRILGRVTFIAAFLAGVWPPFLAVASAQGPIAINAVFAGASNQSSPPGLFAGHLSFVVEVTSTNTVASVTATFAGHSLPLVYGGFYWTGTDLATASLPFGPTAIEIRAIDAVGNIATTQLTRTHDNPPTVEILSPEPDVLARPNVRVHARCTDDGGPCQLFFDSVPGVSGTGEIDRIVSADGLQSRDGDDWLFVRATDSAGQEGIARRTVWVEPSPRLSLVASYPGVIQDIDTSRALVFTNESPRRALIVDRLTGVAQPIFSEPSLQNHLEDAQLTPKGALFTTAENNIVSQLYEWTPGSLVPLGRVVDLEQFVGKVRVEGQWALFSRERPGPFGLVYDLVRRNLASSVEVVVLEGTFNPTSKSDLAANGDVIFVRPNSYSELLRYREGALTTLLTAASAINARTDGTVVAYTAHVGQGERCRVITPNGEDVIADDPTGFSFDLQAREGWVACRKLFSQPAIWTRGPSGERGALDVPISAAIDAVGGDGALLYHVDGSTSAGNRRYFRRGDKPAFDVGRSKWPLQHVDGVWYVIAGPHLFRIVGLESLLSEGATGDFFEMDIALLNPGSEATWAENHFLKEGGEPVFRALPMSPHSRRTIHVNDDAELAAVATSTVVDSTSAPLVVERTMTWDRSGYGGHSGSAVDGPQRRWLFAEGAQGFFDTFILLVNNEARPATVRLTFLVEQGPTVVRQVTVGSRSRVTVYAGAIPELANRSFATVVDASTPIAAERAMYFGVAPLWTGGHESAGVSEPSTRWFHAEGATGTVFDTFILLANPGTETANVVVRFLTSGGATVTRSLTLAPLTRRTINPETVDPQLAAASFATLVESDVPIVSERAMYWSTIGGAWQEAHNSFGVTTTGTKWGTADGRVGGARAYQTYVLVANPSTTATAALVATFMRSDGTQVNRTFTLGPSRRLNIDCNEVPELANSEFGVVVESTNAVPIVVERATYWNAGGILWAGGTNVTASPVP